MTASATGTTTGEGEGRRPWLVTGAAGFLGSHVVDELRRRDLPVVALDGLQWGRLEFLAPRLNDRDFTLVVADLRDAGADQGAARAVPAGERHSPRRAALHPGLCGRPGAGGRDQRAGDAVASSRPVESPGSSGSGSPRQETSTRRPTRPTAKTRLPIRLISTASRSGRGNNWSR